MTSLEGLGGRGINLSGKTVDELAREFEDVVVDRLRKVERTNGSLRRWVGILGLFVALLMAAAAYLGYQVITGAPAFAAQRVTAREFVLADAAGHTRGVWEIGQHGAARIVLQDRSGRPRLRLSVLGDDGSPGLTLLDDHEMPHVVLGILPDGTTSLVFADAAGHSRAVLGVAGDAANLVFADRFGTTRANLGVDAGGRPDMTLVDQGSDSTTSDATADTTPPSSH